MLQVMAKSPGESKIPVFHTNPLKSKISKPLTNLSNRVRAHLDAASKSRASSSAVLFGILSAGGGSLKNVTSGKSSLTVSQISTGNKLSSSHDDLQKSSNVPTTTTTASAPARPTNIFVSGQYFPTAVNIKKSLTESSVAVGKRVRLGSGKEGVLHFVGQTQFGEGTWCGVELDQEEGTTNGTVDNVRYFSCAENRGVFALIENVDLVPEVREYLSDVSDSGPHSLLGVTGDIEQIQQHDNEAASTSEGCFRSKDNAFRYSGSHLHHQQSSQLSTPTPNSSSNDSYALHEWKVNSRHSSSAGSLALSHRGVNLMPGMDPMSASYHMSKHSSFECDESLGILTPDQMGELTTCSTEGHALGGGSCDDFSAFTFHETNNSESTSKTDVVAVQIKYPSLSNIVDVPSAVENSEEGYPCVSSEPPQNEIIDRLFSETDTCMMSVSSISDHIVMTKDDDKFDLTQRTPSLEELPVDDTTLVAAEQPSSGEINADIPAPAPSTTSFVTSVTSIGSWDNGYQGDGECSRPTSRGADASPLARVPKMVTKVLDPMTDSDFYTESDADLYEDVSCLRGDRKARVIDGKLFGSPGSTKMITSQSSYGSKVITGEIADGQHVVGGVNSEEMDSSGIYSDLERKLDVAEKTIMEVAVETLPPPVEDVHSDTSGNSTKSISSQKLVVSDKPNETTSEITDKVKHTTAIAPSSATTSTTTTITTSAATATIAAVPAKPAPKTKSVSKTDTSSSHTAAKSENALKRRTCGTVKKENLKSGEPSGVKPKMPRRNVTSKVKSMISASSKGSEDENQENQQPHPNKIHAKKANGKWSSVLSKIEKSRSDDKCKADKLKDIKSKVACGVPQVSQSKLHKDVKIFSPNGNAINKVTLPSKMSAAALSGSTSSLKDLPSGHRVKTRKTRCTRLGIESSSQSTATVPASISQASSRNSSVTDISDSHVDISQHSLPAVVIPAEYPRAKKASTLLCSPLSEGSVPCVPLPSSQLNGKEAAKISTLPRTKANLKQTGSINSLIENTSSAMKAPKKNVHRRTLPKVPLRDQNRLTNGASAGSCSINKGPLKALPPGDHGHRDVCKNAAKSKTKPVQIAKVNPLLSQLKYTTNGMEAFIILFQRITADMDVFTLPYIKRELTKYKSEWLEMKLKLEEANVSCKRLKEEIETQKLRHESNLEKLRNAHSEQLNMLNSCHKTELNEKTEDYEKQLKQMEEKLKSRETYLESKFNEDLRAIQQKAEQRLESILEETKKQVKILQRENEEWKEKLREQSKKNLKDVQDKVKVQIEQIESKYERKLNEAAEELRKKEEQFVSFSNKRAENLLKRKLNGTQEERELSNENVIPHGFKADFQNLEEEVCSLRTVLDLKQSEIQDLRKLNEKLHGEVQDLPFVMQKLDSAQARVEDLSAQLETKIENEKKLLKENRKLMETVHAEAEKRNRLAFQNEELLWKLKRSTQVAKTLAVFNSNRGKEQSESEAMSQSTPINPNHCHRKLNLIRNGNAEKCLKRSRTDNDIKSTDTSPSQDADVSSKVLGVVEKSDSVSWVLELDESPAAVASRMLRRANSLRGVPSSKKKTHSRAMLKLPALKKRQEVEDTSTSKVDFGVQCCDIDSTLDEMDVVSGPIAKPSRSDETFEGSESPKKPTNEEDENIISDISSIFDFLQDTDLDPDGLLTEEEHHVADFYTSEKALRTPFSTSSSSNSSLNLDIYDWTPRKGDKALGESAPIDVAHSPGHSCSSSLTSRSTSDCDDSESSSSSSFIPPNIETKLTTI
ncbi:serine-rich adhesin for platelets isoform X2 [Planococcus citri]|uniref:serine-rich adhesin for platelets isoform X2 n=1 Tax=Planococcus citri TaxID=170843 RepID=UPI0031F92491